MQIYYFILYFFIYGFIGWCTEVAYATVKQKKFVNRGFLNGPICPVYGVGIGMVVMLLEPMNGTLVSLYVVSTVLVTTIEGLTGYLMDKPDTVQKSPDLPTTTSRALLSTTPGARSAAPDTMNSK